MMILSTALGMCALPPQKYIHENIENIGNSLQSSNGENLKNNIIYGTGFKTLPYFNLVSIEEIF